MVGSPVAPSAAIPTEYWSTRMLALPWIKQYWSLGTINSAKLPSPNWYVFVTSAGSVVILEMQVTTTSVEFSEATTRNTSNARLPFSGAVANCFPR